MLVFLGFSLITIFIARPLLHSDSANTLASLHAMCVSSCPLSEHAWLYRTIVCGNPVVDSGVRADFVQTGLIHLLIVSGQHFTFLELMVDRVSAKWPNWARWSFGALIIGGFTLASGSCPPAIRASLSWLSRHLRDRFQLGWSRVQIAAASVVLTLPFCSRESDFVSLALSGTAAVALAMVPARKKRRGDSKARRFFDAARAAVALQVRVYVCIAPVLACIAIPHPLSIVWNVVGGPLIGHLLFPMSLLCFVLPAATGVVNRIWDLSLASVHMMSRWTPPSLLPSALSTGLSLFYATGLLVYALVRERRARSRIAMIALLVLCATRAHAASEIVVWNVGQGAWSTVIEDEACLHFDAGGEFAPWQAIRARCEGRHNFFYFSHWDWDHVAFGPRFLKASGGCIAAMPGGDADARRRHLFDGFPRCEQSPKNVREVIARGLLKKSSRNEASRVFTTAHALFPGDAPKNEEKRLLSPPRIRVLVLPHHGSRTSSSDLLLDELRPHLAIASARFAKYGHPHAEVIERLHARGIPLLRTEEWGSIHIEDQGR